MTYPNYPGKKVIHFEKLGCFLHVFIGIVANVLNWFFEMVLSVVYEDRTVLAHELSCTLISGKVLCLHPETESIFRWKIRQWLCCIRLNPAFALFTQCFIGMCLGWVAWGPVFWYRILYVSNLDE